MMYALADAEKYWRHKRREVRNNECELFTEEECTNKMREYHNEYVICYNKEVNNPSN